jgi:hypothetical protein
VVIGVNNAGAGSTMSPLRYAERDATAVAKVLSDPRTGTFDPSDVTLFTGGRARAADIKSTLRRIVAASEPSECVALMNLQLFELGREPEARG